MSRVDIRGRKDELVDLPGPTVLELACSGRAARSAMSVGNVRPQFPSAMSAGRQRLSWAYLRIADCRVRRFGDRCALYPEVPPGLGPDGGVTSVGCCGRLDTRARRQWGVDFSCGIHRAIVCRPSLVRRRNCKPDVLPLSDHSRPQRRPGPPAAPSPRASPAARPAPGAVLRLDAARVRRRRGDDARPGPPAPSQRHRPGTHP